jgi:septum formation protein
MPPEIILASGSPRRRELLAQLGVKFEVVTAEVEERMPPETDDAPALAALNAALKARAVARQHPGRWVLGADTIVVLGKRVLGKPKTLGTAFEYLAALSGRTHEVITGCCLVDPEGQIRPFFDISHVTFHELTREVIAKYVTEVDVLDKAGAYALQNRGWNLVERIEGSSNNIIGLPTEKLVEEFRAARLL